MTGSANGDLLSVDCPQNAVEARWLSFVGEFPNVSDVMHDNLPCTFSANATWLAKF